MADGGAITLRLSLQGAEQVRAELAKTGPAGAAMARELDRAMRQPGAGLKALDAGAKEARRSVESLASSAGPAGNVLQSFGGWGLAAAAGVAALIGVLAQAISMSNQATAFAADLTDAADRIGIGTEALQEWRYVADEAGVPVQSLERDLETLNGTLGKFKMGIGDAKLKPWFEELGIKKADLDSIQTADQLMILLADRLGQISDRSRQVAAARAFGIEESLPALRLGADRLRELLEASRELGVVLDRETIAKLDAADRKAELAGQQLKTLAFGAVEPLATALANLGAWIGNVTVEFDKVMSKAPSWASTLLTVAKMLPGSGAFAHGFEMAAGQMLRGRAPGGASNRDAGVDLPSNLAEQLQNLADGDSGFDPKGHTDTAAAAAARAAAAKAAQEAARRQREAERAIEQLQRQDFDAQRDWLNAVIAGKETAEGRAEAARLLLDLDHAEAQAALDKVRATIEAGGLMTDEVRARLEQIEVLRGDVQQARARQIEERRQREQREAMLQAEQAHAEVTAAILDIAASTARTSDERRAIELQLLEVAQRQQRAGLLAAIEAEKEPAKRASLNQLLDRLPKLFEAQANQVRRQNAGPVASWWDAQMTGPQAQEWMQGQALDALDGVNRGLIDAYKNIENAGDAFDAMGDVAVNALQKIADGLLEIALQRMLIQPLANALFGGASGGGGLLSGLLGSAVGGLFGGGLSPKSAGGAVTATGGKGFGRGGLNGATGLYPVGEFGMELMEVPAGARIYDTDRSQRIITDALRAGAHGVRADAPAVQPQVSIRVFNQSGVPVQARTRTGPDGMIDVFLDKAIDARLAEKGADGSLNRALMLTPRGKRR